MSGEAVDVVDETEESPESPVAISTLADGTSLEIVDRIERRRYTIRSPGRVTPVHAEATSIPEPVDRAVEVTTNALELPFRESVYVRDGAWNEVGHHFNTSCSYPADQYFLEITTSLKLYIAVEAAVTVRSREGSTRIEFGGPTAVVIGASSQHRQPIGTINTTERIDDLASAVSALSAALTTTSPERSYPRRRTHPPLIEIGDELSIPSYIKPPKTGLTVEVRQSLDDLLTVAPLAFYLGAEIAWGEPQLKTPAGFVEPLRYGGDLEAGVERVLKRVFFMDCLTRTEGKFPVELDERRRFEARVGDRLDFAELYEQSSSERLEAYLAIEYSKMVDLVPTWSATTYVEPTPEAVSVLPFLLDRLSTVRTGTPSELGVGRPGVISGSASDTRGARSTEAATGFVDTGPHLVLPNQDSAVPYAWVGNGIPIDATKALVDGFRHRLSREPVDGDIRIQVVCADPEMRDELESVSAVYRSRPELPFDVDVRTGVTTDQLRAAIERESEFLHYIGHVDGAGFRCRDGWLDANECSGVGPDVFLLNSCRSYEQGELLVEKGAVAGIVTLVDLLNHRAAEIGRTLGLYLNHGFPLYAALQIVHDSFRFGGAYTVLGDAHVAVSQPTTTFPEYLEMRGRSSGSVTVSHRTFPSHVAGMGTMICPPYDVGERHYLFGGEINTVTLTEDELDELLSLPMPLRDGNELRFHTGTTSSERA